MAVGAYTMAILVLKAGSRFWLALPLAMPDQRWSSG